LLFLEVGGESLREPSEHFNGCAQGLFQIEGDLCFKEKSIVEPVEGVAPRWSQDFELHKVLQIFGRHAQDRAGLLEFQLDALHLGYTIYILDAI